MPIPAQSHSYGKLIISGEHAVVHGCPALVMALPFLCKARLRPLPQTSDIYLNLRELNTQMQLTWEEASSRVQNALSKHIAFMKGECDITEVLSQSSELVLAAALSLAPRGGWELTIESDVPVRAGLGSSAAAIVATLKVIDAAFSLQNSQARLWQLGRTVEALQHGRSSGADIAAALYGGILRFQEGFMTPLDQITLPLDWQLWYSGKPACSTGETVSEVRKNFPHGHSIWQYFAEVEAKVEEALTSRNRVALLEAIRKNNQLLCSIGVVPKEIENIVQSIEGLGGAAKICGAGAIRGTAAGAVLVFCQDGPSFTSIESLLSSWRRLV